MDGLLDMVGYLAASLVFAAFYVKEIKTLRLIAIGSNIAFIIYGFGDRLYPIFILHALLLPLNLYRLFEIKKANGGYKHLDFRTKYFTRHLTRYKKNKQYMSNI